jgi:hypothetical protein
VTRNASNLVCSERPSLNLIFKYAVCFNGFEAFGGLERLGEMANEKLFFYSEHSLWCGSARELRACLFFEERRWRHFGYPPEGNDLEGVLALFERIQFLVRGGELAPNDEPDVDVFGAPVVVDGVPSRLLEWREAEGLVLAIALDESGEVVERRCPPSVIIPDDRRLLAHVDWLFCRAQSLQ